MRNNSARYSGEQVRGDSLTAAADGVKRCREHLPFGRQQEGFLPSLLSNEVLSVVTPVFVALDCTLIYLSLPVFCIGVTSPRSSGSRSRSRYVSECTNVLIGQGRLHGGCG